MEPLTIATAIATIFFTKALEKTGEKFGEATLAKTKEAIAKIREHSPEIAGQLESGDREVLSLGKAVLESLPIDLIFVDRKLCCNDLETQTECLQYFENCCKFWIAFDRE